MRITIAAVGRLRSGPENGLVHDYLERANSAGRQIALGPFGVTEIDERKARDRDQQSRLIAAALPAGAHTIALDERGTLMSSPDFAQRLAGLRDRGTAETVFLIGGAEGLSDELRGRAQTMLSFGPMVWPHLLARVMLAEQLYRAVSILTNAPYHRA